MSGRYDHDGWYRNTTSAAASTLSCSPKCTSAAPIDASGRISRGNHTLVTRLAVADDRRGAAAEARGEEVVRQQAGRAGRSGSTGSTPG